MPMKKTIEIKKDEKGFGTLYVNDEPFLILGGELHNCATCSLLKRWRTALFQSVL